MYELPANMTPLSRGSRFEHFFILIFVFINVITNVDSSNYSPLLNTKNLMSTTNFRSYGIHSSKAVQMSSLY